MFYLKVTLIVLEINAVFQIIDVIPHMAAALKIAIPPAVTSALDAVKPHKPVVLNWLAILEPLYILYLILIFYWNGVISIPLYIAWVFARYQYSPYTKFAIDFLGGHINQVADKQAAVKPHWEKAKELLRKANAAFPQ